MIAIYAEQAFEDLHQLLANIAHIFRNDLLAIFLKLLTIVVEQENELSDIVYN